MVNRYLIFLSHSAGLQGYRAKVLLAKASPQATETGLREAKFKFNFSK